MEQETIKIILPDLDRWQETKELRLTALKTDPQAFADTYEETLAYPDQKWQTRLIEAIEGKVSKSYYAELEGKLVGMVVLRYDQDNDTGEKIANAFAVYVLPEFRGRGISSLLMNKLIEAAREKGIQKIFLDVNATQEAAFKLYENNGFSVIETQENFFLNNQFPNVTNYVMELKLR